MPSEYFPVVWTVRLESHGEQRETVYRWWWRRRCGGYHQEPGDQVLLHCRHFTIQNSLNKEWCTSDDDTNDSDNDNDYDDVDGEGA